MKKMNEETKNLIKDACKRLNGYRRRAYQAHITIKYFDASTYKAEREMGWGRECVIKGLSEVRTGIRCLDNFQGRGIKKTEDMIPGLKEDIISLAEPQTQADPAMKSSLTYTRITGKTLRNALIDEKGYNDKSLPCENTLINMLNRMGYNLSLIHI